jgi:hypothetical protein
LKAGCRHFADLSAIALVTAEDSSFHRRADAEKTRITRKPNLIRKARKQHSPSGEGSSRKKPGNGKHLYHPSIRSQEERDEDEQNDILIPVFRI